MRNNANDESIRRIKEDSSQKRGPSLKFKTTLNNYLILRFLVINSRTAIAGAIIGLLLVFLQFKEFELYWGAVFCF